MDGELVQTVARQTATVPTGSEATCLIGGMLLARLGGLGPRGVIVLHSIKVISLALTKKVGKVKGAIL